MGRTPCCDKVGLKKGPWTPEEDQMLLAYIEEHGHGSWRSLPSKAGLQRCGKSCRLRWTNYLRPDIKRGKFNLQEEQTIIQLHALLGNRWSAIATHLPKRTDNEIKNYWNTHLKKRLEKMGIDPVTHKPKNVEALFSGDDHSKKAANLSHMAQWECARLEAEARLVRQSKLRSNSFQNQLGSPALNLSSASTPMAPPNPPPCHDKLKAWKVAWNTANEASAGGGGGSSGDLVAVHTGEVASPTSTLSFSEIAPPVTATGTGESSTRFIEFVGNSSGSCEQDWKRLGDSTRLPEFGSGLENSMAFTPGIDGVTLSSVESSLIPESLRSGNHVNNGGNFVERFTELLLNNSGDRSFSDGVGDQSNVGRRGDYYEDNKSYWNSILNLVNASSSDPPLF